MVEALKIQRKIDNPTLPHMEITMNEKKSNIIKLLAIILVIFLIVFYIAHKVYGVNFWKPHDEYISGVPQHMKGDHADTKRE